jgi:hypothetical protein
MVDDVGRRRRRCCEIGLDRRLDLGRALLQESLFVGLGP